MDINKTALLKQILMKCKSLKTNVERSLNDSSTEPMGRYVTYKIFANEYNNLVGQTCTLLAISPETFTRFNVNIMADWADSLWPQQKQIVEAVNVYNDSLIAILENYFEFANDEFDNLENFIRTRLRTVIFEQPTKEIQVQNAIESLFAGKSWLKGIDYDREAGKFMFSGKEYIPDFIIPKLKLCIEVKLLREGRKSKIIEEINADITAYSKKYERQLFIVYDLGVIRDEVEFIRDIENSGKDIKVLIIKH